MVNLETVFRSGVGAKCAALAKLPGVIGYPNRRPTMTKYLYITTLVLLVSCGQTNNNSDKNKVANHTTQGTITTADIVKHDTFNEPIDTLSETLKSFIPSGYSAINVSSGDANLDGLTDKILVLRNNTEETTSNYADDKPDKRPLLLLLGQSDGSYKLAIRNDNVIECIDCGGMFGDPFVGTAIQNGYFSIEHGIAGGQHWEKTTTFKFDKTQENWFLYEDHFISYKFNDSNDPDAEALVTDIDNLKTTKDFGKVSFDKYDTYKNE